MCTACVLTFGGFVGAVALAKSGGLGGAKTAIVAFALQRIWRRAR